ncbi:hypothetical protein GGR56DRAFT_654201 [Xylariaceae sp. FL0804]|nr:hypothetical protein GGR56DRAFT_654201 [Xylariaceae sp. FL0804]
MSADLLEGVTLLVGLLTALRSRRFMQSRTSSIFAAFKSPRKSKSPKGISILSPIMNPCRGRSVSAP